MKKFFFGAFALFFSFAMLGMSHATYTKVDPPRLVHEYAFPNASQYSYGNIPPRSHIHKKRKGYLSLKWYAKRGR